MNRAYIKPPKARPTRNVTSIVVNEYTELPITRLKARVQAFSYISDAKPDKPKEHRTTKPNHEGRSAEFASGAVTTCGSGATSTSGAALLRMRSTMRIIAAIRRLIPAAR